MRKKRLIKKRFLNFRHFGRFRSPNSDLCAGQTGANCETFWRVKSMFAQRHVHVNAIFRLTEHTFSIRPSREALTPKNQNGGNCETFWRLSHQKHGII